MRPFGRPDAVPPSLKRQECNHEHQSDGHTSNRAKTVLSRTRKLRASKVTEAPATTLLMNAIMLAAAVKKATPAAIWEPERVGLRPGPQLA